MKWEIGESKEFISREDVTYYLKKIAEYEVAEVSNKEITKAIDLQTQKETDKFKKSTMGLDTKVNDIIETFEVIKKSKKGIFQPDDNLNNLYLCEFSINSTNGSYSSEQLNRLNQDNCKSFYDLSKKTVSSYYKILFYMLFCVFFIIITFANTGFSNPIINIIDIGLIFSLFYLGKKSRNRYYQDNIKMKEDTLKFIKQNIHANAHSVIPYTGNEDWIYLGLSKKETNKLKTKHQKEKLNI